MRVVFVIIMFVASAMGQGVRLSALWSADTVTVGMPVTLRLEIELPEGTVPHFPELEIDDEAVSIVNARYEPMAVDYRFTFWELGKMVLPGIPVRYIDSRGSESIIKTDSLTIFVATSLIGNEEDIKSLKKMRLINLTDPKSTWLKFAALVILAVLIIFIFRRRKLHKQLRELTPIHDPIKVALADLARLREQPYHPTRADAYYLELSRILREYLESRYLFRALEMTTSEIKELLQERIPDPSTAVLIGQLLEQSDIAKFAGQRQHRNRWRNDIDMVERIIARTIKKVAAKEPDKLAVKPAN
ncbi:hypothetical protein ACFL6E_06395 [Candidatus Neomarinimicrobiota bacterium]